MSNSKVHSPVLDKQKFTGRLIKEILLAILALIFSCSISLLFIKFANIPLQTASVIVINLLIFLIFDVVFYSWKTLAVSSTLLGIFAIILFFVPKLNVNMREFFTTYSKKFKDAGVLLENFVTEGFSFFDKTLSRRESASYAFIGFLLILLFAIISFILIQKLCNYWLPWILSILSLTLSITINSGENLVLVIPMFLVSILLILLGSGQILNLLEFKSRSKHILKGSSHLALILVLALLTSVFVGTKIKHKNIYSSYLQGIMDDIMTIFPQSLQPDLTVNSFSIGKDGFYPLGEDRLGGSVILRNKKIAELKGSVNKLLKVQSSDFYNGLAWYRTVNNPNYRYDSPFNRGSELEVFNPIGDKNFFAKLKNVKIDEVFDKYSYSLRPLVQGSQILFLSGTPTELRSSREEALLFYFNQSGTIYAKTSFNNYHPYELISYEINPLKLGFSGNSVASENPERLKNLDDAANKILKEKQVLDNYKNAYDNYLQLPDLELYKETGKIYALAKSVTEGINGEYSKVQAILNYFKHNNNFRYSLEVDVPPENMDFVEHFLETKLGYCTYYASAMTLFSRINGIPARFVEGYSLSDENLKKLAEGKIGELNSKEAHAWVEVYLNGLGWIALDPTPTETDDNAPSPSPSPSPIPTPSPTQEETTTSTSEEITTTTSSIEETTSSSNELTSTTNPENQENNNEIWNILAKILLSMLILLAIAFIVYYYYKKRYEHINNIHKIDFVKSKLKDSKSRVNFYWKELLALQNILDNFLPKSNMTELKLGKLLDEKYLALLTAKEENPMFEVPKFTKDEKIEIAENKEAYSESAVKEIDWNKITEIIAESKYSQHELDEEKLNYLAKNFDILEDFVNAEIGEAAYIRKRVLPPKQGII